MCTYECIHSTIGPDHTSIVAVPRSGAMTATTATTITTTTKSTTTPSDDGANTSATPVKLHVNSARPSLFFLLTPQSRPWSQH